MPPAEANPADAGQSGVVTRFAPSPTGFLHIGGARTALFNWLYARRHGGRFLLRIEDTDRARSTPEATAAIHGGLRWLELDWDGEAVSQHARADRHRAAAEAMLASGAAYRCYATKEEIDAAKDAAREAGAPPLFNSPWRERDASEASGDAPFVIRLKAPREGVTRIDDAVQGEVAWENATLDDLVLLRSDGAPTYMLAVVVDDHEMGVTDVIRGDDHLTNAARQTLIYQGLGWTPPRFAHIPLIHGADGAKLSKRHGALGVEAYRDMGFLPEGLRNYLARLGWSHGDAEIFSTEEAVAWFGLEAIGKGPSRFDLEKLRHVNAQHMKRASAERLMGQLDGLRAATGAEALNGAGRDRLTAVAAAVADRSKTLLDFQQIGAFALADRPIPMDEKSNKALSTEALPLLRDILSHLKSLQNWTQEQIDEGVRQTASEHGVKFGAIAQPLRAALTGQASSPGVLDTAVALGREEALGRLEDAIDRLS
ncbi:MAG: glutamate--tRNA ligase [Pseudomonadota bacterium]